MAAASPQSNGQVERTNRVIIPALAKLSNDGDWSRKLGEVEFAINNTVCRSTGFSPSTLLFGVPQRGNVIDKLAEYLNNQTDTSRDLEEFREVASAKISSEQAKNKDHYDQRHKSPHKYKVNDLVMVCNFDTTPGVNKKLIPKYRGPYKIATVLPNDRYRVIDTENWQITQRPYEGTHGPAQLRPYLSARE